MFLLKILLIILVFFLLFGATIHNLGIHQDIWIAAILVVLAAWLAHRMRREKKEERR